MGMYSSRLSAVVKEDVAIQCDRATMASSPSHNNLFSNQTPTSLSGIDAIIGNCPSTTEAIVVSAIQKCLHDPELVKQLADAVAKATTKSESKMNKDASAVEHHHFISDEGHAIDESCEALDLIGLSDGSDTTIKVETHFKKRPFRTQSENQIIDDTPEKSEPVTLKQAIFSASGPTFQERSADRQRLLNLRWRTAGQRRTGRPGFTIGDSERKNSDEGGDDAKTMALIRSQTRHKCGFSSTTEQILHLDSEINRLRKQCLSQEIQLSLRRNSAKAGKQGSKGGKSSTTPTSTNSKSRHDSFGHDQQIGDDLMTTFGLTQDPSPKSARFLLRKVTNCLDDIREAICLISDGLEAVDLLLSGEGNDEMELENIITRTAGEVDSPNNNCQTPMNTSKTANSTNPVALCKSVPAAKSSYDKTSKGKENAPASAAYRKTSASFSVSASGEKRAKVKPAEENSGIWQI